MACTMTNTGQHEMEWVAVPASVINPGMSDERMLAPAHERGICWACGEQDVR